MKTEWSRNKHNIFTSLDQNISVFISPEKEIFFFFVPSVVDIVRNNAEAHKWSWMVREPKKKSLLANSTP